MPQGVRTQSRLASNSWTMVCETDIKSAVRKNNRTIHRKAMSVVMNQERGVS